MYTIDDIDVFVKTHNRAKFLKETLDCLVKQTIRPKKITVLDNESVDNTEEVVKTYEKNGVVYVKTFGRFGNFYKSKELADKEFFISFHDDNLIHPQFFEKALYALNNCSDISAVTCSYSLFWDSSQEGDILPKRLIDTVPLRNNFLFLNSKKEFLINNICAETYPFPKISPCIPALIARTSFLKEHEPLDELYGKANDIALYLKFVESGKLVLISDENTVFIRQHMNRDLFLDDNSLSLQQAANWISLYTKELWNEENKDIWISFLEMIYLLYPVLVKKSVKEKYSTEDFIRYLDKQNIIPRFCKEIYNDFPTLSSVRNFKKEKHELSTEDVEIIEKKSLLEKIFSVKNKKYRNPKKIKIFTFFGIKIILGEKNV